MNHPILVTGAAGFIGSHLVEALLDRDENVIGLDNLSGGTKKNLVNALENKKFVFTKGDIRDQDLLLDLLQKYDIKLIYHQADSYKVAKLPRRTHPSYIQFCLS